MSVLYITQNGIADHIGQSQVAPYLLGLAARGHRIHVLSAEKPGNDALVADYAARFAAAGIGWTRIEYHNRPPLLSTAWDLWRMIRAGRRIMASERIAVIHCRSHPAMLVGQALKRGGDARLIFDFRDFWADGGIAKGRFVPVYRWAKQREAGMIADADHVVCLTERAADHLAAAYPDAAGRDRYSVIPCCADFALFTPQDGAPVRAALEIPGNASVLLYLGSLGPDYLLAPMMALFARLRLRDPGAVFLFVANNGRDQAMAAARAAGIPEDAIRFTASPREAVPAHIAAADLSVVFIRADLSKLGCSPTKLAEVLACGKPVIGNAGVGDLDAILSPLLNGSVAVADFDDHMLDAALATVLDAPGRPDAATIRANSVAFSLDAGISAYAAVYEALGA